MALGALLAAPASGASSGFAHAALDTLLHRHVRGADVDYAAWSARAADRAALRSYVTRLGAADTTGWPRAEQLAFWINAYNAITLERVLAAYPVSSITKIRPTLGVLPGNGVWKEPHRVAGHDMSLDDIEHVTLRRHFADPRIHFAINCASKSCPPLAARAYRAGSLEADLDAAVRRFVRSPRYNTIAPGRAWKLSKIFEWYADDFASAAGSVPAWVIRWLPAEQAAAIDARTVRWTTRPYDWALNRP